MGTQVGSRLRAPMYPTWSDQLEITVHCEGSMKAARYPGIRVTANGNQLVAYHTETRIADAGVFYPITPSTEGGELFQQAYAEGKLNVFGSNTIAIEAEGEHAAQGGAIAHSVCGKRVVNFTSGQGVVYGVS